MILQGNSYRIPLRDESVHSIISSFPYFNLRSYQGIPPTIWGGDSNCRHIWQTQVEKRGNGGERDYGSYDGAVGRGPAVKLPESAFCQLCGAWLGCFGLESSIGQHVQNAVAVCREIKRVLRKDGVLWLNYGDSFSGGKNGRSAAATKAAGNDDRTFRDKPFSVTELPAKNLCMIPARVAIALQDDGWILRSEMGWYKANAMPSSVTDRPGTAHEHVFMFAKSARYYYDGEAVRRAHADPKWINGALNKGWKRKSNSKIDASRNDGEAFSEGKGYSETINPAGRALRTSDAFFDSLDAAIAHLQDIRDNGGMLVDEDGMPAALVVNSESYKYSHYATFPRRLVAPLIKTTPEKVCPNCAAPWVRVKEPTPEYADLLAQNKGTNHVVKPAEELVIGSRGKAMTKHGGISAAYVTTGWRPTCDCIKKRAPNFEMTGGDILELAAEVAAELAPVGGIILDPFAGSGTVGEVCREHGRRFIGIDLSATYLAENALGRAEKKTSAKLMGQLPMFAGDDHLQAAIEIVADYLIEKLNEPA